MTCLVTQSVFVCSLADCGCDVSVSLLDFVKVGFPLSFVENKCPQFSDDLAIWIDTAHVSIKGFLPSEY